MTTLRDNKGRVRKKVVYKKDVSAHYPKDKDYLAQFSQQHPAIIERYRESLRLASSKVPRLALEGVTESGLAKHLAEQLIAIPPGASSADDYHKLMVGIISFLFFPNLIYPQLEAKINQGRKRLDVLYTNGKESGIFFRLAMDQHVLANLVHVECKNYTSDIANPEFDQLIGRFDADRGRLGILLYRSADKPDVVMQRARDAAKARQGIVLPLDDQFILAALKAVEDKMRDTLDSLLDAIYRQVVS